MKMVILSKKDKVSRLLQLAPLEQNERAAWTFLLPYMDEVQLTKLEEILEKDVAKLQEVVKENK